jgi:ABC-type nitrate/sulfonate/bicarbonate transport system substrate-binding protein
MLKTRTILVFVAVCCVVVIMILLRNHKQEHGPPVSDNLASHPIYRAYDFGDSKTVINLGTQPLYSPTGFITETMERDAILARELSALGLSIRFHPFLKGTDVNYFILRGALAAGVGGDMPALSLAGQTGLVIPTFMQQGPISIVTRKYMLLDDMRGKKIAYAPGSIAHFVLFELLSEANLIHDDVQLIAMDVHEMASALSSGSIDVFAAWEPTPEIAELKYSYVKSYQSISTGYLYFSKVFFDKHPAAIRQIIAAQLRAVRWLMADSENLQSASAWVLSKSEKLTGEKYEINRVQNAQLAKKDILGNRISSSLAIPSEMLADNGILHREFKFLKKFGEIMPEIQWAQVRASFYQSLTQDIINNPSIYPLNEFEYGQ